MRGRGLIKLNVFVVEKIKKSGAIILGKTNTSEFGAIGTCENNLGPPCKNPWDTTKTSGGSSGGTGDSQL